MSSKQDSGVVQAELVPTTGPTTMKDRLAELQEAHEAGLLSASELAEAKLKLIDNFAAGARGSTGGGGGGTTISAQPAVVAEPMVMDRTATATATTAAAGAAEQQQWAANFPKMSAEDIAGSYCCFDLRPPFPFGCFTYRSIGPDRLEQIGWCATTVLVCCVLETLTRVPNTNR